MMDDSCFHPSHIPPEILSLPAKKVLNFGNVKDKLSLQLNMRGSLKNWEHVASDLGYSSEEILGFFAHQYKPGWSLLRDWIYKKNGLLKQLVDVLDKLELLACLETIYVDVKDYEKKIVNKKQATEDGDHVNGTGVEANKKNLSLPSNVSNKVDFNQTEGHSGHQTDTNKTMGNLNNVKRCDKSTKSEASYPQLLRMSSWCAPSVESSSIAFQRSLSVPNGTTQPNDDSLGLCSNNEARKKKKSLIKTLNRWRLKKKNNKKSAILHETRQSNIQEENGLNTRSTLLVHTASGSYSENPKKEPENSSPLVVESDGRKSSLTDSLSSVGSSLSSPTSPGCDSGYFSSDAPSVSHWKTISIIHCSGMEQPVEEVWKLFESFKSLGYNCHLDKLELLKIAENKYRYAVKQVKQSDFLFICVSPELKRIFDSPPEDISDCLEDDSKSVLRLESDLILADLSEHFINRNGRFMNIMLKGATRSDIPCFLASYMRYQWPEEEKRIRFMIEGQPEFVASPVSNIRNDPPSLVVRPAVLS